MDDIDREIIRLLRKDSRMPFLHIAKTIGTSEGTIRHRVKELTIRGIIKKFTIDAKSTYFAFIGIKTDPKEKTINVLKRIKKSGIEKAFEVTGKFDALIFLGEMPREDANKIIDSIRATKGITATETFTVLEEVF